MFTELLEAGMYTIWDCNGTMTTLRVLGCYLACVWPTPRTTSSPPRPPRPSQIWSPAPPRPSCRACPGWWWRARRSYRWERWAPGEKLSGLSVLTLRSSQSFTECCNVVSLATLTGPLAQVIISGFNTSVFSLPILSCLFVFFKVLRYHSYSHVLHRRVKYNLR